MEAGRGVAEGLLGSMDVPYYVAAPLLLQDMASWRKSGVTGLQSVVLYALPELDGAVDAVVLGALEGDDIVLEQERVTKLCRRVSRRVGLRNTPARDRKVGLVLYGFPPNVGAVGTAALLNVPRSLDAILHTLQNAGYDAPTGLSGEALVAGVAWLCRPDVINGGAARMITSLEAAARRAKAGDPNVAEALREFIDEADTFRGDVTVIADARSRDDVGDTLTTVHKSNCRDASPPRLTD
jgi:magnesium chelatase subunit H